MVKAKEDLLHSTGSHEKRQRRKHFSPSSAIFKTQTGALGLNRERTGAGRMGCIIKWS
jgi:hypothetical protein